MKETLDKLERLDRKLAGLRAQVRGCSNLLHNAQKEADKLAPCDVGDKIHLDKGGKGEVQRLLYNGTENGKALFDITILTPDNEYEIIKMVRVL
jgi:hypothetical protein